jgi:hypothetical protein
VQHDLAASLRFETLVSLRLPETPQLVNVEIANTGALHIERVAVDVRREAARTVAVAVSRQRSISTYVAIY